MPTKNPKITAYVPQEIYDRFDEFRKSRNISMSQAMTEVLIEYFGMAKEMSPNQVSVVEFELLKQRVLEFEEQVKPSHSRKLRAVDGLGKENIRKQLNLFEKVEPSG